MARNTTDDGLKSLVEMGLINKDVTIAKLIKFADSVGAFEEGDGVASKWGFIVKGKWIWHDDGESVKE